MQNLKKSVIEMVPNKIIDYSNFPLKSIKSHKN
jgi:hypothetical protein